MHCAFLLNLRMFVFNCKMRAYLILLFFIASCSLREQDLMESADKIEIIFFNNGDKLRQISTSKSLIKDFKKVLNGKIEPVNCTPSGQVVFYSDGSVIYATFFSTDAAGENDCVFLMLENRGWRMTYRVGMYLDETYSELKKSNE